MFVICILRRAHFNEHMSRTQLQLQPQTPIHVSSAYMICLALLIEWIGRYCMQTANKTQTVCAQFSYVKFISVCGVQLRSQVPVFARRTILVIMITIIIISAVRGMRILWVKNGSKWNRKKRVELPPETGHWTINLREKQIDGISFLSLAGLLRHTSTSSW